MRGNNIYIMPTSIFIPDRGAENIYHFIVYMLANLRHIDYVPDIIYIDLKKNMLRHNYIIEVLTAIYPNARLVDTKVCPKNCLSLKQSPGPETREAGVSPEEYVYLRSLFLPLIASYKPSRTYSKYVYISRWMDSNKRRLINEQALFNKGLPHFERLVLSGIPLLEQMFIFNNAKVIISCHGAALVHSLVCNSDVRIIEIASKKMAELQHFKHIATTLGLSHNHYTDVTDRTPNHYESDLLINDIDAFIASTLL